MENILVVDDEPMIRSLMDHTLSMMGYSVTEAGSVTEALKKFESEEMRFDALVTDYNLEDGNGFDIMRSVRSRSEETPVILMTGSMKITRSDSLQKGFSAYFHKPFSCVELGKKLDRLLDREDMQIEIE